MAAPGSLTMRFPQGPIEWRRDSLIISLLVLAISLSCTAFIVTKLNSIHDSTMLLKATVDLQTETNRGLADQVIQRVNKLDFRVGKLEAEQHAIEIKLQDNTAQMKRIKTLLARN
jgi:hypothetical protein